MDKDAVKPTSGEIIEQREQRVKYVNTICKLADSNIGTDPSGNSPDSLMSTAFTGLLQYDGNSPVLIDTLVEAGNQRRQTEYPMRPIHGALIFVYAVNHLMLHERNHENYAAEFELDKPENWGKVYRLIEEDPGLLEQLGNLLKEKELMTSNPRRANDLNFIIKRAIGRNIGTWTDLGSSMGFPVLATLSGDTDPELMSFQDDTIPGQDVGYLKAACKDPVQAQKIVLVDHTDPYKDFNWFLSCCYPVDATSDKVARSCDRIKKYHGKNHIEFEERNMMNQPTRPHESDLVTAIMSGYELDRKSQAELLESIMPQHITEGGAMIVKDYIDIDENGRLVFVDDRNSYRCKTAIQVPSMAKRWFIVTDHSTSRCHTTKGGPDLPDFMEQTARLPHNNY